MISNKLLKGNNVDEIITFPLYGRERDVGDGLRVITDVSEGDKIATINQTSGEVTVFEIVKIKIFTDIGFKTIIEDTKTLKRKVIFGYILPDEYKKFEYINHCISDWTISIF